MERSYPCVPVQARNLQLRIQNLGDEGFVTASMLGVDTRLQAVPVNLTPSLTTPKRIPLHEIFDVLSLMQRRNGFQLVQRFLPLNSEWELVGFRMCGICSIFAKEPYQVKEISYSKGCSGTLSLIL
jgi:hypothetical protein